MLCSDKRSARITRRDDTEAMADIANLKGLGSSHSNRVCVVSVRKNDREHEVDQRITK